MCLTEEALETVENLPYKDPAERKDVNKILGYLENHLVGKVNEIYESYRFFSRQQEEFESISAYVTAVHALASTCNFGDLRERLIRDRMRHLHDTRAPFWTGIGTGSRALQVQDPNGGSRVRCRFWPHKKALPSSSLSFLAAKKTPYRYPLSAMQTSTRSIKTKGEKPKRQTSSFFFTSETT